MDWVRFQSPTPVHTPSQSFAAQITLVLLVKLAAVVLYTPVFFFPSLLIGALGSWLGQVYMKSQLSLKREMSNAKAPVLAVFNSAVVGLGE